MQNNIKLTKANTHNANDISYLINLAYRGEKGWTKENQIFNGDRTSEEQIRSLLTKAETHFFVVIPNKDPTQDDTKKLIASICIENKGNSAYIGLFAVHPNYQEAGIGKQVLEQAEVFIKKELQLKYISMAVISQRTELIAYYRRRGYIPTGENEDFPYHLNVGTAKVNNLRIEHLKKTL